MRVLSLTALLALALALALWGCGGGGAPTAAPATPVAQFSPPASTAQGPAPSGSLTPVEVVRLLRPSVVHIQTEETRLDVFGRLVPVGGVGTGVIIDDRGHMVTNDHVIRIDGQTARRIRVSLSDGRALEARLVGRDPLTDLAVLQVDASGLVPARLGDASQLEVAEEVVAIGHALNLPGGPTVSKGVISAKGRLIQEGSLTIPEAIQTDAAIDRGNSGGPLVNMRGEVVGINTQVIGQLGAFGLAISVDTVKSIAAQLIERGRVERGFLGINIVDNSPSMAAANELAVDRGIIVAEVQRGGPADRAGLRPGDIIVRLAGQEVRHNGDLRQVLTRHRGGERVEVEFFRGPTLLSARVTLA